MSNNENLDNENHTSGLIYFMPEWIFSHPELSQTEKMVYSLLSGLAHGNEEKTCFPSDNWIGKRMKISRQQANESVASLERVGAISKITMPHENNPFRRKRIITVYLCPQKMFTMSGKADTGRTGKADTGEAGKPDLENKKDIKHKGSRKRSTHEGPDSHFSHAYYKNYKVEDTDKPKKKPSQAKAAPSAIASELSEFFLSEIKKQKEDFKTPNLEKWAKEFDAMMKIDRRDPNKIKELILWIAQGKAQFTYIQSPSKLRHNFDEQEMRKDFEPKNKQIFKNRLYAMHIAKQYPRQYADLTYDKERAIHVKKGMAISLDDDHENFKRSLHKLFGVNT